MLPIYGFSRAGAAPWTGERVFDIIVPCARQLLGSSAPPGAYASPQTTPGRRDRWRGEPWSPCATSGGSTRDGGPGGRSSGGISTLSWPTGAMRSSSATAVPGAGSPSEGRPVRHRLLTSSPNLLDLLSKSCNTFPSHAGRVGIAGGGVEMASSPAAALASSPVAEA